MVKGKYRSNSMSNSHSRRIKTDTTKGNPLVNEQNSCYGTSTHLLLGLPYIYQVVNRSSPYEWQTEKKEERNNLVTQSTMHKMNLIGE